MKFIMMLLSVYRITYMVVNEIGPLDVFEKLRTKISKRALDEELNGVQYRFWRNFDDGLNCEYCTSVWISGLVWLISKIPILGKIFLGIFGLAGAWMLLQQWIESNEQE